MSFSIVTALGMFALGRRLAGAAVAWLAVLFWLTTPWTYRISIIAYTEGALACYLVLTLLALVIALQSRSDASPGHALRWVFVTGLLAGSAAASKYPGVLSVVVPVGLVVLWTAGRSTEDSGERTAKSRLKAAAVYSVGVLLTFGPWLLKNLIETGNPVYPLLWSVFGGESFDAATNARWQAAHGPPTWLLKQPGQIFPDLWQKIQDVFLRSDWQSPILGALVPLSLLTWRGIRSLRWVWVYVLWLFLTWLWLTHRIDRFWVPMNSLLALLAAFGCHGLWNAIRSKRRKSSLVGTSAGGLLAVVVTVCALFNLTFNTTGLSGFSGYLLDEDAARDIATLDSIKLCRAAGAAEGGTVLFVGEAAVFDANFPSVYNTVWDDSLFETWCAEPVDGAPKSAWPLRDAAAIRATFAAEGITHICVRWDEVLRYRAPGSYGFTDFVRPSRFDALVEAGVLQRTPYILQTDWEQVDEVKRQLIADWAPELSVQSQGEELMRRIEVYRVRR